MAEHSIEQVVAAWAAAGAAVRTGRGVPAQQLVAAQERLGRPLPGEVSALYRATDGVDIGPDTLVLHPLLGSDEDLGVVEAADTYRSWGWEIPDELVVLGSDAGDRVYGVWAPSGARRTLVVVAEESLEGPALAVVGTSLAGFLAAWTAYHLPRSRGETAEVAACLDLLEVPQGLREGESEFDEEHLHALLAWASPGLPDEEPDPSARPVPTRRLDELARG